ncbi:MAG TPA: ferritin family protein [Dehalococcoidia bacterium]|nr:ferritin family protein [Dehalococcoidia bacterium]
MTDLQGGVQVSISFYGNELINIAIGIERRGIAFYDVLARSTQNAKAREIFHYLVGMEREHIQIFQGMLDEADKFEVPEAYAGEYAAYLQALVDSAVFTDDAVTSELATRSGSDAAAVELGISAEKDSILFYYELREMMPKPGRATIDKIIAEEKLHLRQLSDLKKALSA